MKLRFCSRDLIQYDVLLILTLNSEIRFLIERDINFFLVYFWNRYWVFLVGFTFGITHSERVHQKKNWIYNWKYCEFYNQDQYFLRFDCIYLPWFGIFGFIWTKSLGLTGSIIYRVWCIEEFHIKTHQFYILSKISYTLACSWFHNVSRSMDSKVRREEGGDGYARSLIVFYVDFTLIWFFESVRSAI